MNSTSTTCWTMRETFFKTSPRLDWQAARGSTASTNGGAAVLKPFPRAAFAILKNVRRLFISERGCKAQNNPAAHIGCEPGRARFSA